MKLSIQKLWYEKSLLCWFFLPFSFCYTLVSRIRRWYLLTFHQRHFPVPLIVVGNITVGGTGKTPLVIAIAKFLCAKGCFVGIVSRGYKATVSRFPYEVSLSDEATKVGDEPLLIAKKTGCPVVIAPRRVEAVNYLLKKYSCHIIISDDGMQHYAMGRAIEIAVIDGIRKMGNGFCLPAGPLRESIKRLDQVDFIIANGGQWPKAYSMHYLPGKLTHLLTGTQLMPEIFNSEVIAIAGIGYPESFFTSLQNLGISFKKYPFPDHHDFRQEELPFTDKIVVMTEKDAVKCHAFAADTWYFLPIEAQLDDSFWQALWKAILHYSGMNNMYSRCS